MISDELVEIFQDELRDLLESLDRALLDLKRRPEAADLVDQVFRDLHTIKGNGGMFGFSALSAFIHDFETAFDRIRSGKAKVTPEVIRLALAARDEIPALVQGREDVDGHRADILRALALETSGETAIAHDTAADPQPMADVEGRAFLRFRLEGEALGLGVRPELLLAELAEIGATEIEADLSALPDLTQIDPSQCYLQWKCRLPEGLDPGRIEDVFMFVDAVWSFDGPDLVDEQEADEAVEEEVSTVAVAAVPAAPKVAEPTQKAAPEKAVAATVRVPADRLDALMDAVGELVIVEARLTELARLSRDAALVNTAEQITRLAAGLRDAAMTMRMVPMRTLVGRFRRLVSELSDSLGKPVDFVVEGEETELDKTLIEKLADPIVHLLRNALDHGVETPAERKAAGKPEMSRIGMRAVHSGAEVLVHISDDGHGLNADRIRTKAVAQGLIAPDAVLTEGQLYELIFAPGFSTAQKVTELSGRGVGMDVVRRMIDSLRGTIEVKSASGQGTTVTLRLPLTLAIIEGLLVEIAGERYALPMESVLEIVELPAAKSTATASGDFLDIRGGFVPFLRLRNVFDCDGPAPASQNVVVVGTENSKVGIVVDRIIGTNQVVIKQMSKLHAHVRVISGATILGDGSVALILDISHLLALGREKAQSKKQFAEVLA